MGFIAPKAPQTIKIFIAVGEASGDELAASLIHSLNQFIDTNHPNLKSNIEIVAVAGKKLKEQLKKQKFKTLFDNKELAVMGVFEILLSLPKLLRLRKKIYDYCLNWKADIFIGVDSPDFYLSLEKKLKAQKIQTVHLVCPSVYAWRSYRLKKIAQSVDLLIGILPFEKKFIKNYCKNNNIELNYQNITHPIYAHKPRIKTTSKSKNKLNLTELNTTKRVIGVFLGSRKNEIKRHLAVIIQFIKEVSISHPDFIFISSVVHIEQKQFIEKTINQAKISSVFFVVLNQFQEVIDLSELILTKSGTINLYCTKAHKPMIIFHKLHPFTFLLAKKLMHRPFVSPANWALAEKFFPELLQSDFTVQNLKDNFKKILADLTQFNDAFKRIDQIFYQNKLETQSSKKYEINHDGAKLIWKLIEKKLNQLNH